MSGGGIARGSGVALGAAAAFAALLWDPAAPAADAKRAALLVAAAAALAAALGRLSRGAPAAPPGRAVALWMAFVGWSALSLLWGDAAGAGVGALGIWAGAAAIGLAAALLPVGGARWAAGAAGAILGGGSALIAIAQAAGGGRGLAIHGGHGNPNWLGLVIAIALPPALDLAAALRREGSRLWPAAAALAAVEVPALLLSRSRVAWAAAALTLGAWAIATASGWRRAAGAAAIVAGAALAGASSGADVPLAAAWEGRAWIWRSSADAAVAALPVGAGLGGFADAYLDAQGARLAGLDPPAAARRFLNATTAHNDWIQAAAEGGAPGLALLAAAVGAGLLAAWRARWHAGAAAIGAFAICACGDSPLQLPAGAALLSLTLAAAPAPSRAALPRAVIARRSRRRWVAGLLIALAAAALLLAASARTWIAARRLTAARDAEPGARLARLERAARLDSWSGEAALALGLARLDLGDAAGALRELTRSRALLANVGTDVALGNALLEQGAPERAAAAYRRALRRHPGSLRAHANLVEALVRLGALDEAEAHLAAARSISPGHPRLPAIAERLRRARIDAEAAGTR